MRTRRSVLSMGFGMLLTALLALSTASVLAQDATPAAETAAARPAHIHAGSCPEVGDVVAPLTDLTSPAGAATADIGTPAAAMAAAMGSAPVEYSYTNVPLALDDILAGEHAINVHESAENIQTYIACGDLAGTVDANGTLAIGLRELNGSGFTGVAVLTPSPIDPATTDVSVFIASDLSEGGV